MNFWFRHYSLPGFFLLLLITHILASISSFSLIDRQSLWISGILTSFLWIKQTDKKQAEFHNSRQSKKEAPYPSWAWVLLIAIGIFLRSLRFWAFPHWPLFDETSILQFALELNRHWDWKFFYTDGQIPPLLIWATAILLKIFQNSFLALELPVFLVSCLTLLAGWGAARRFLPEKWAYLSTAFLALAYWPLYLQSLSIQAICLPVWEIGVFFLLAETFKKESNWFWIGILGAWLGLGYWTYTSWPVVTLAALIISIIGIKQSGWNIRSLLLLGFGLFTTGFYFLVASFQSGGYGTHLVGYSAFHGWIPAKQVLFSSLDYVNFIFWGYWSEGIYAPIQCGFLNPLMAAFFWIGLWKVFNQKKLSALKRWIIPLLLLFLLPGILSQSLQSYRVIQVILPVLGLCALGACRLLTFLPARTRPAALSLILLISLAWDIPRLAGTLTGFTSSTAPIRMVFETLKNIAQNQGPGLCFTQFKVCRPIEESLEAVIYPFNAVENPRFIFHNSHWASLLVHPDEIPFFQKDFPAVYWLKPPIINRGDDLLAIGIIPINPEEGPRFEKWITMNLWLQKGDWEYLNVSNTQSYQEALNYWLNPPDFIKGDQFLETCYWERLAEFYYERGYETHYEVQLAALKHAVTDGYPAPHLYYDLGCLLLRRKNFAESRKAFEKALRGDPHNPDVEYALQLQGKMEKNPPDSN